MLHSIKRHLVPYTFIFFLFVSFQLQAQDCSGPCESGAQLYQICLEFSGGACTFPGPAAQTACDVNDFNITVDPIVDVVITGSKGGQTTSNSYDDISQGDIICIGSGVSKMNNDVTIVTSTSDGTTVLQDVTFHASCSQPLDIGDAFGAFTIVSIVTKQNSECWSTIDYGDAPDDYGTSIAADGAGHVTGGPTLGDVAPDAETNGNPGETATGDGSDEEGLASSPTIIIASDPSFNVEYTKDASESIIICAWVDLDIDSTFNIAEEQICTTITDASTSGTVLLQFNGDFDLSNNPIASYLRLRVSTCESASANSRAIDCATGVMSPTGILPDGEVEDYVLDIAGAILAVELADFSVALEAQDHAMIKWKTHSEIENDFFSIEKSMDGVEFTSIGTVAGAGTTALLQQYEFTDRGVEPGVNYYRLAAVALDGEMSWSEVKSIEGLQEDWILYPNPAVSEVNLHLPTAAVVTVTSVVGERLMEQSKEAGLNTIDLSDLVPGTYAVQVKTANGIATRLLSVQ